MQEPSRTLVVKEVGELAAVLGLNENQKQKLELESLKVQVASQRTMVEMKPEQFHSIDIAPVGIGNARLTFPVDVTREFRSKRTKFDVYTIRDKKEVLAFFLGGKFDSIQEPVIIMVPKKGTEEET